MSSKATAVDFDEEKWRSESDARTLAEAHAIGQDPDRMKKATKAAKDLADEMQKHAKETADSADAMQMLASKMYPSMAGGQAEGNEQ
jgi:hypothetical protein